jgi:hypothetical protein
VIDACCRGYQGSIDELVGEVTAAVNGNPVNIRAFIHALQAVGGLTDTKPSAYFIGDTPAKRAAIGTEELVFSAPSVCWPKTENTCGLITRESSWRG